MMWVRLKPTCHRPPAPLSLSGEPPPGQPVARIKKGDPAAMMTDRWWRQYCVRAHGNGRGSLRLSRDTAPAHKHGTPLSEKTRRICGRLHHRILAGLSHDETCCQVSSVATEPAAFRRNAQMSLSRPRGALELASIQLECCRARAVPRGNGQCFTVAHMYPHVDC